MRKQVLLAAVALTTGQAPQGRDLTAITDVTVIDGTGAGPRPHLTVVIDGNSIVAIAPAGSPQLPATTQQISGAGKFLIPGLWDMHTHIGYAGDVTMELLLANGVTSVRELGGDLAVVDWWRERIGHRELVGPRIFRAGPVVDGSKPGVPNRMVVETDEDGRRAVQYLHQRGVDVVKVHTAVPQTAYLALLKEARTAGIGVVGHIPWEVDPLTAINAGHHSVEHVVSLFEGPVRRLVSSGQTEADAMAEIASDERIAALGRAMAKSGTWFAPTLVAYDVRTRFLNVPQTSDPRHQYVSASLLGYWRQVPAIADSPERRARLAEGFRNFMRVARIARDQKVRFLVGTDVAAPNVLPGFSLHDELRLLVDIGFSPLEVISIATRNGAESLGRLRELGTIEVGKRADMVMLDANPVVDIANTRRIHAVVADGRLYRRAALDTLLADVATRGSRR
jgi:imidazolonepropionase-like amidohydrolase